MNQEQKDLLTQNVSVTVAADVLYMVSRFFLPPLILSYISLEAYGIWSVCFIIIGYIGMSAIGVSNVYLRFVAEYQAKGEMQKISRLITTGLISTLSVGLVILAAIWILLPWLISLFKVSDVLERPAQVLIFATCATFVLHLSLGSFVYVLEGLQQFTPGKLIWIGSFLLEALLIAVLLKLNYGLYALMMAFSARYVFSIVLSYLACRKAVPELSLHPRNLDKEMIRLFFRYGGIVQLTGLLSMFLRSIEKVLSSVFLGVSSTGLFEIGEKLPIMANSIPHCIAGPILPAMSQMHARGQKEQIVDLYQKSTRYMAMISGLLMGFLAAFAGPIIQIWIGVDPQYAQAATILALFTLPFQLEMLTAPASALHQGAEHPERALRYPLFQLVSVAIFVGLAFWIYAPSILSISLAVGLGMMVSALIYIAYTNRLVGSSHLAFFKQSLIPGMIPYVFGFALSACFNPLVSHFSNSRIYLSFFAMVFGVVYTLITGTFFYHVILISHERAAMGVQLFRLAARFLPQKGTQE